MSFLKIRIFFMQWGGFHIGTFEFMFHMCSIVALAVNQNCRVVTSM